MVDCHEHRFQPISRKDYQTFYQDQKDIRTGKVISAPIQIRTQIYECLDCGFRTNITPEEFKIK